MELVTDDAKLTRLAELLAVGVGPGVGPRGQGRAGVAIESAAPIRMPPTPVPPPTSGPSLVPSGPALVFTRSLKRAEQVAKYLATRGVSVALLHRDLSQVRQGLRGLIGV